MRCSVNRWRASAAAGSPSQLVSRVRFEPAAASMMAVQHQHGIAVRVGQQRLQRLGIACRRGVADDVHRIAARPGGGQRRVQPGHRLRRQLGQRTVEIDQRVGGQHAGPAAIGQDRQPLALRRPGRGQRLHRIEQFAHLINAQRAGPPEGGVIDRIGPGQCAGVRGSRPCPLRMAAGLDDDDRFQAGAGPRRRHEFPRVGNRFDIEQHRLGAGIGGQIIQHVAEIHIRHVTQRDEMREADAARRRPVQHGGHHGARLGDEGDVAGARCYMCEAGVQPGARRHDAQAVRPDDAQQVRLCRVQRCLPQCAAAPVAIVVGRTQAGGDDDGGFRAARAQLGDQAGHAVRWGADHRQIGHQRQAGDIRVGQHPFHRAMLRVDRHDRPFESGVKQVARHHRADRSGPRAGADQGHRGGLEEMFQIANAHACSPVGAVSVCSGHALHSRAAPCGSPGPECTVRPDWPGTWRRS